MSLGVFFVLLNLPYEYLLVTGRKELPPAGSTAEEIGEYIGSQLFIIIGLYFLIKTFLLSKKVKQIKDLQMEEIIDEIGNNQ